MDGPTHGVDFVERAGEEHRAVEAGVEGAQVVGVGVFDFDAREHLVPAGFPLFHQSVKVAVAQFLQVQFGLFYADKR